MREKGFTLGNVYTLRHINGTEDKKVTSICTFSELRLRFTAKTRKKVNDVKNFKNSNNNLKEMII